MTRRTAKTWRIIGWIILILIVILAVIVFLNRIWLIDWYSGLNYSPSTEMAAIRDRLALTDQGTFLFNATQPALNEATEFNQICRDDASEVAVLGCYAGDRIHVYNITAPEFDGIREVTAAHELLHAKWTRMSESERNELASALSEVLANNSGSLADELNTYDNSARTEELYVRAGTEISDLPEQLTKHYNQLFKDRSKIVNFYNSYVAVFEETKARAEELESELTELKSTIDADLQKFDQTANQLAQDVSEFNDCASTPNCFKNQAEFITERNTLLGRQQALNEASNEINDLINSYNSKIDEYNQNAARSQELQSKINSASTPEVNL